MGSKSHTPTTPALRLLRRHGITVTEHTYAYVEHGGTAAVAQALGVDEHGVIKTLVFEDDRENALIVLMHGDRNVSAKELARQIGVKKVRPAGPPTAERCTGYRVGGISPFGTRRPLPVYAEESIFALPRIYINGGRRGFIVGVQPDALEAVLHPEPVSVALSP
jgi:Cys-tRNA(Pro) deacylase